MSCNHGNPTGGCDTCDEDDARYAEWEAKVAALKARLTAERAKVEELEEQVARMTEALSRLVKVYDVRRTRHDGVLGTDWDGSPDNGAAGFAWNEALSVIRVMP